MYLLLLLFWLSAPNEQSSKSIPDSLKAQLKVSKTDSLRAATMLDLAKYYYPFDQDSALYFTDQVLEITTGNSLLRLRANAHNIAGVALLIKSDFEKSLQNHLKALKIREALPDSIGIMESNLNIGNIYYRTAAGAKAAGNYKTALEIAKKINHERGMSLLFNNIGSFYFDRWKEGGADEDFDQAREYLENSREIKEKLKDSANLIHTLNLLGEIYLESGRTQIGEDVLRQALAISSKQNNLEARMSILMKFATLYQTRNMRSEAMRYAKEAYQIALSISSPYHIRLISKKISDIAAERNDYSQAYEFLQVYADNSDSIYNESREKIRNELFIQYETEKKELENQKLLQEQRLTEFALDRKNEFLIFLICLAAVLLVFIYALRRSNLKLKSANEKLTLAHAQLQEQKDKIEWQTQSLQEKNEELNKANKFRDKLFSIISHDLRSPFHSLQNSISLWSEGDLEKEEMDYILKLVSKDTENAYSMLNNLLGWARIQIGSNQLIESSFNLHKLVDETIRLFEFQIREKSLLVENNVNLNTNWTTDKERLNFVIRNILKNAIKFTPKGGQISFTFNDGCLIIRDTGIGMSEKQVENLYGPGQYTTPGTDGESGTGIGFMLARDFALSIGAQIEVKSEIDNGTAFAICFEKDDLQD